MNETLEILEQYDRFATVLVARESPDVASELIQDLMDAGINVVGPVNTARDALALIAQTPVDLALITPALAGRRDGRELARHLSEIWGVPAVMLS